MRETCETCRYMEPTASPGPVGIVGREAAWERGFCRRFPPVAGWSERNEKPASMLPQVCIGDWCGEYQPRKSGGQTR